MKKLLQWLTRSLERLGVIEHHRVRSVVDLAWPRIITGLARRSTQTADIIMVGWVLGPAGIAGLSFAYAYWQIGMQLSLGVSGGVISLVSQNYGGEADSRAEVAIKMGVWLAIALAVPMVLVFHLFAADLIRLLGAAPDTVAHGATYLHVVSYALVFEYLNKIGSRAFAGVDDTFTPMVIRAGGAVLNLVLNLVLVLGLGLGVFGAALGTTVATVATAVAFAWGFLGGNYPVGTASPIRLRIRGPQWDTTIGRQLLSISVPLILRKLATSLVVFPFLAIAAVFGTIVVAAFEVSRQVRHLANSLNWGFSIASSSLVGQHLGRGDEREAAAFGWDILRLSVVSYIMFVAVLIIFARPIAGVFVSDPASLDQSVGFVVVGAISAIGLGIDGAAHGVLRAGGDTLWPFYGRLVGLYGCAIPIAYLGVGTAVGIYMLYAALLLETFVPAIVNFYRLRTNKWQAISRQYRPQSTE